MSTFSKGKEKNLLISCVICNKILLEPILVEGFHECLLPVASHKCLYHLLKSKWHYFILIVIFPESFLTGMELTVLHISYREALGITRTVCTRKSVVHVQIQ